MKTSGSDKLGSIKAASDVLLDDYKRTKIIATVGPSTDSYELVYDLIKNGANGLRLNFSHGDHAEHGQRIKWIRKASKALDKPVAIIQDLQGPKVRCGDFDGFIPVEAGQNLSFKYGADYEKTGLIPMQYDLAKKVKRGERLYVYDGKIKTVVTSVKDGVVHVRAENAGIFVKRKGMNLPDTDFGGDIITEKDRKDLAYGSTQDIDYVALSFVQTVEDIANLRRMLNNLGSNAKIIAKVETNAAVDNIESIVRESDAVMIARGDLAVETPLESVPVVQRKIVSLGMRYAKPTIVATQMLASMTEMPEPTRAEVSDVATAVLIGADCVMLSDETASGKYPIEAVKVMKRIVCYTECHSPETISFTRHDDHSRQSAISGGIISLAESIGAKAIVAETRSGSTALQIGSRRPSIPIIAVTSDPRTAQQLDSSFGTESFTRPVHKLAAQKLTDWLQQTKVFGKGDIIVSASGQYPGVVGTTDTIKVRVLE
jgi:pyruvate kinase